MMGRPLPVESADAMTVRMAAIRAVIARHSIPALESQLRKCEQLMAGFADVDVAVVGRFKAGKSSLLNHLAQRALLPSGVVPVTAVITRLAYAETENVTVHFSSGSTQRIAPNEISGYVSERENRNNAKGVTEVNVGTPALQRYGSLRLVDTPGLSSVIAHNTETAREWLPKLGAAILAVSVDAPLSDEDLRTLEQLRELTPKTALVLTKVDLLSEAERREVVSFVREKLDQGFSGQVTVFEYSVRPGYESLRNHFDEQWLLPMADNYAQARQQIAEHKLRSIAEQIRSYLKVSLAVATEKAAAGQELKNKISHERGRFHLLQTEIALLAQRYAGSALDEALKHLGTFETTLVRELVSEFDGQAANWNFAVPKLIHTFRHWLHEILTKQLQTLSRRERAAMCRPVVQIDEHLGRLLQGFQNGLAAEVRALLGIELSVRSFESEIEPPSAPPVSVGPVFDTPLDLLGYLLPVPIFGPLVKRRMRRSLRLEVEKNLSRLASEWSRRIAQTIHRIASEAEHFADEQLALLERALEQRPNEATQLQGDIAEVERLAVERITA